MTVRVTAAVYRGFLRLNPHFTHRHWVGIRDCTNLFRLAVSVVFVKQSPLPCYCNLQSPLRKTTGISSRELTRLFCRVPWTGLSQHTFAFSACLPVTVLGMDMKDPSKLDFHGLQESTELCIRRAIPAFISFSSLQDSRDFNS